MQAQRRLTANVLVGTRAAPALPASQNELCHHCHRSACPLGS